MVPDLALEGAAGWKMASDACLSEADESDRVVSSKEAVSDRPTFVGIAITTPEQARETGQQGDGVIHSPVVSTAAALSLGLVFVQWNAIAAGTDAVAIC